MGRHFIDEGGLPIDISVLAQLALKCRAYAKALHYKEQEHNKKLDLPVSY
jgi:FKBP12-rapamycin complex-associated protein